MHRCSELIGAIAAALAKAQAELHAPSLGAGRVHRSASLQPTNVGTDTSSEQTLTVTVNAVTDLRADVDSFAFDEDDMV